MHNYKDFLSNRIQELQQRQELQQPQLSYQLLSVQQSNDDENTYLFDDMLRKYNQMSLAKPSSWVFWVRKLPIKIFL